jgi:hypothetical protein
LRTFENILKQLETVMLISFEFLAFVVQRLVVSGMISQACTLDRLPAIMIIMTKIIRLYPDLVRSGKIPLAKMPSLPYRPTIIKYTNCDDWSKIAPHSHQLLLSSSMAFWPSAMSIRFKPNLNSDAGGLHLSSCYSKLGPWEHTLA